MTVRRIVTGSANKCLVRIGVDEYFLKKKDVQVYNKSGKNYDAKLLQDNPDDVNGKVIIFYAYTFIINSSSTILKSSKANRSPTTSISTPDGAKTLPRAKIRL